MFKAQAIDNSPSDIALRQGIHKHLQIRHLHTFQNL